MNRGSEQARSQTGSGHTSSYHIQRWGGETRREEPWRQGDSRETRIDRAKTRIDNFDKRWDQSQCCWICCNCSYGRNSLTYTPTCPMCNHQRCKGCLVDQNSSSRSS